MNNSFLIFIGAGLGGFFRYWISLATYSFLGRQFPYGTLVVNVSGCFLMGLLFVLLLDHFVEGASALRSFLLIGLLGGYTTFSSFSLETLNLIENGSFSTALLNMLLSVALCMVAVWLGVLGGRQL